MPFVSATPPPNMPSGTTIFQRAENAWHAQALPKYVEFTTFSAQISDDPIRVIIRTADGKAFAETIPPSSRQKPVKFPGVDLEGPGHSQLGFCVTDLHCTGVLGADPFGGGFAGGGTYRTIAAVRAFSIPYVITDTQYLDFDGTPAYDLKLEPKTDPLRFRMREIVIDASTYHVWKMIYAEPANAKRELVYGFGPVADMWYLRQTCDAVPVEYTGLAVPACTPDVAMMWDYSFPDAVPDDDFVAADQPAKTLVIVADPG
ncbi:MAG TPA: hypothetical protein VGZ02_06680 [Candidatus Baltobacteraceae bacterium]|jgi:hypothetical protein|nr:hypothetical protein [Candidatus Baltobacteraceae bacterium]